MNDGPDGTPLDLGGLYADRTPRAELEDQVAADYLRFIGERRAAAPRFSRARSVLRVAAGLVLFIAGFGLARILPGDDRGAASLASASAEEPFEGRRFMLLLWEGPGFGANASHGQLAAEYTAWARATAGTGIAISGHELSAERELVPLARETASAPNSDFRIGGYFVVAVADAPAARRLAEAHPHIGHGGWIEVAEIQ